MSSGLLNSVCRGVLCMKGRLEKSQSDRSMKTRPPEELHNRNFTARNCKGNEGLRADFESHLEFMNTVSGKYQRVA